MYKGRHKLQHVRSDNIHRKVKICAKILIYKITNKVEAKKVCDHSRFDLNLREDWRQMGFYGFFFYSFVTEEVTQIQSLFCTRSHVIGDNKFHCGLCDYSL